MPKRSPEASQLWLPFDGRPQPAPRLQAAPKPAERAAEARAGNQFLLAARQRRCQNVRGVRVTFRPFRSTLYSFRLDESGIAHVRFHVHFREAGDRVLFEAAHLMLCRTRRARRSLARSAYDAFVGAFPPDAFDLPGARSGVRKARPIPGRFRSLEDSFARVNSGYFGGLLGRPELCWSPKCSKRILGTYHDRDDRIIVSRVFDSPKVPPFVLDYLMYHELLHKFLGVGRRLDGRRCMHGKEFRGLERRYAQYREAIEFLKKL